MSDLKLIAEAVGRALARRLICEGRGLKPALRLCELGRGVRNRRNTGTAGGLYVRPFRRIWAAMKTYDVIVIGGGHARESAPSLVCVPAR